MTKTEFIQKQGLPYEAKIVHAEIRAREFYEKMVGEGKNVHVSVGGLDSITLFYFLRHIGLSVPGISVSSLEDKSIQAIHKQMGLITIRPLKSKTQVIQEFGYPIVSKEKASKIEHLQRPDNPKQTFIHAIMTGDMGEQGGYRHSERIKLPEKWIKLFGGLYNDHRPDLQCRVAPFKVSNRCCYWMKEKPADTWAKEHNSYPYLGLMASEGGQRRLGLMKNGCNYYGKSTTRSCPFAPFLRQDLLQLVLDLNVPVPEIYGQIAKKEDGTLYTTRAQRTGCSMCGFGIHLDKRPHHFDYLWQSNPQEWEFWMHTMGWADVLGYIGVGWDEPWKLFETV